MWETMTPATRKAVLRLYRAMPNPAGEGGALAAALRPLDRPALVIWGATDWGLPVALADRQREAFPRADIHVLSDSGHYPQFDDPDRVTSLVVPFLRTHVRD
jgi:pimeloyl-ACP methyl ester carboxylesterase